MESPFPLSSHIQETPECCFLSARQVLGLMFLIHTPAQRGAKGWSHNHILFWLQEMDLHRFH